MEEVIEKAKVWLVKKPKGPAGHDRPALFAEWLRTEPAEFPSSGPWAKSKNINPMTLQKWGGRGKWNQAREAVRMEAMRKAIAKTPDMLEKKFEKQFEIVSILEDAIKGALLKLVAEPDPPAKPPENATPEQVKSYMLDLREYARAKAAVNADQIRTLNEAFAKSVPSAFLGGT